MRPVTRLRSIPGLVVNDVEGPICLEINSVYSALQDQARGDLSLKPGFHQVRPDPGVMTGDKRTQLSESLLRPTPFVFLAPEPHPVAAPVLPQKLHHSLHVALLQRHFGQEFLQGIVHVVSHGEVGSWPTVLVTETVNVTELVLLWALTEAGHSGGREPQ